MGCQEPDFGSTHCDRHYYSSRSQQGVCPVCLTEKLLYLASTIANSCTSSCSSSPTSSNSSSTYGSPPHRRRASDVACSIGFIMGEGRKGNGDCNGLSKSRSVAQVANNAGGRKKKKKKGGFWSKLLRLPGKRSKEALGHSRNSKEGFEYYIY